MCVCVWLCLCVLDSTLTHSVLREALFLTPSLEVRGETHTTEEVRVESEVAIHSHDNYTSKAYCLDTVGYPGPTFKSLSCKLQSLRCLQNHKMTNNIRREGCENCPLFSPVFLSFPEGIITHLQHVAEMTEQSAAEKHIHVHLYWNGLITSPTFIHLLPAHLSIHLIPPYI